MEPLDNVDWERLARETYRIPEPDPDWARPLTRIEDAVNAAYAVAETED